MFGRFTSQERTNVHRTAFFFTPVISHCLKTQLSKEYGGKTLLGAAKSLEVTFPRVSRRGRHFANVGDVIIYPDLVVARTADPIQHRACNMTGQKQLSSNKILRYA